MFGDKVHDLESSAGGSSKYINYGHTEAAVTGYEIKEAQTGSKKVNLLLETPTVTEAGFEADATAKRGGKIGRVALTTYMKDPSGLSGEEKVKAMKAYEDLEKNIQIIANKCGEKVYQAVLAVKASSLEDYLNKVIPLIQKVDLHWLIAAEEYAMNDKGYPKYTLKFVRFGFVASQEEGVAHLKPFDKENPYHYKKLEATADAQESAPAKTDW
jgi:hypothetical protein